MAKKKSQDLAPIDPAELTVDVSTYQTNAELERAQEAQEDIQDEMAKVVFPSISLRDMDDESEHFGYVLAWKPYRSFYAEAYDEDNTAGPDCTSFDGRHGKGVPGGNCVDEAGKPVCPNAMPGSGFKKGAACPERLTVFFMEEDDDEIKIIRLPQTSRQNFRIGYLGASTQKYPRLNRMFVRVRLGWKKHPRSPSGAYTFKVVSSIMQEVLSQNEVTPQMLREDPNICKEEIKDAMDALRESAEIAAAVTISQIGLGERESDDTENLSEAEGTI